MDAEVAPLDHVFPEDALEDNVTVPPWQKLVGPPGLIVGVAGKGFTVTVFELEVAVQ